MLKEISEIEYYTLFETSSNPFLKREFYVVTKNKVEAVKFLINEEPKPSIGLILGLKDNQLLSPYSAPFGGFHFNNSNIYIDKIEEFAKNLRAYFTSNNFDFFKCTFPPSIYGTSFNHKMINAMTRLGFKLETPELTSHVDLDDFNNRFKQKNSREYYNQAVRNKLIFKQIFNIEGHGTVVDLIKENRERSGRKLHMGLADFKKIESFWEVNYFGVFDSENEIVAAAIFYLFPEYRLVYTTIWGDSLKGRSLRGMDFLSFEMLSYFKKNNFRYIDLGISTEEDSVPNVGLLRFKETHEARTEMRFTLTLKA